MADMLVKLYNIKSQTETINLTGVKIVRALAPNKHYLVDFVKQNFSDYWSSECDVAFANQPISCFIAVRGENLIGFACYDVIAKSFFGPLGVIEKEQKKGIGKALLIRSLLSMRELGYGYAIIGSVGKQDAFYRKTVQAELIANSSPGIYVDLLKGKTKK